MVGEVQNNTVTQNYLRGINLIRREAGTATDYYLFNAHGDVVNLVNTVGVVTQSYDYDAFGVEKDPDPLDTNHFRYCGEYLDAETGRYYLRARYYDITIGRFTQQDPILDGLNWYSYCGNNPILYVDPYGLERIVISGGAYNNDPSKKYQYEFVDSALLLIREWNAQSKETIGWAVSTAGWSDKEIERIEAAAKENNVNLLMFDNVDVLIDYINNGSNNNRSEDLITNIMIYSHGFSSSVEFGYYHPNSDDLMLSKEKISEINPSAFAVSSQTTFFSCNAAFGLEDSIAMAWAVQTGSRTRGLYGRSDYSRINACNITRFSFWLYYKLVRSKSGGYNSPFSAFTSPRPGHIEYSRNKSYWLTFTGDGKYEG